MIVPNSIDDDLKILDRYQSYSSEIIRLSLLGISGVGILYTANNNYELLALSNTETKFFFIASIFAFGFSTASGIFHKYHSTNSVACILKMIRIKESLEKNDSQEKALEEAKKERDQFFKCSEKSLNFCFFSLALGAILLAFGFLSAMCPCR